MTWVVMGPKVIGNVTIYAYDFLFDFNKNLASMLQVYSFGVMVSHLSKVADMSISIYMYSKVKQVRP